MTFSYFMLWGSPPGGHHSHKCFEVVICSYHTATHWPLHTIRCLFQRPAPPPTTNHPEENRRFTSDSSCGYCFPSRSVEAKGMCCIFWMLVTRVMPTGCGLSIRRLRRSRRTWQPYRYISPPLNPTDYNRIRPVTSFRYTRAHLR